MSDDKERDAFLAESNVAVLATVDARGRAHAAPIWYLYDDGVFIMSTGRGSQKHRNIEGNPEVTRVVDRRNPSVLRCDGARRRRNRPAALRRGPSAHRQPLSERRADPAVHGADGRPGFHLAAPQAPEADRVHRAGRQVGLAARCYRLKNASIPSTSSHVTSTRKEPPPFN